MSLFGDDTKFEAEDACKLRVYYAVLSESFREKYAAHIPRDKSLDAASALHCARSGECLDDAEWIDLGTVAGEFVVHMVPLWTAPERRGPDGQSAVAAILRPAWEGRMPARERQTGSF